MRSPRERMVISAALLIRERGAHATAISDVLEHSGAPRGSAYHYFPGRAHPTALRGGGLRRRACRRDHRRGRRTAPELMDTLIDNYRHQLLDSDFRAGCPVVAVSVEAGEATSGSAWRPVVERAASVFDRWTDLIAQRFIADGIIRASGPATWRCWPPPRSRARSCVARVRRDLTPLDVVHRQLRDLLSAETTRKDVPQ